MIFEENSIKKYITEQIDLGDGELMACIDFGDADAFCSALEAQGYTAEKRFTVGSTDGVFYKNGDDTVYFYKNSGIPFARAVYGAKLASDENPIGEELYDDTIFYQVYNDPDTASGMTYLIRMKDGSFVIIDGGFNIDAAGLINVMRRIHPLYDPSKPFEVAAWILTHPHDDHCQLLHRVMTEKIVKAKLNIRRLMFDFSANELILKRDPVWAPEAARVREYAEKLRGGGTEIIKPHTGMTYEIGELYMKVFFSAAEYAVTDAVSVNDASLVFTMQNECGKKLMILGDTGEVSGDYLLKMHKPEQIHADIVQVAHHGLNGPAYPLYEAISASCYFWMINIRAYKARASKTKLNTKLRESGAFNIFSCFGEAHVRL